MSENNINECGSDAESTEEEIEPKLKYVRMSNDLQDILQKETASCIAVHPKFVCLGTNWGIVHLFDHQGNSIRARDLKSHAVAVNRISIDVQGERVASCSYDGKIHVSGLYSGDEDQTLNMGRQVGAVALDPATDQGRIRYISGDDRRLTLHEKTFGFLVGRLRSTVLCESEGSVGSVAWSGRFVAWSSSIGVRVYDINARCSLGLIQWESSATDAPLDTYRCNLRWADPRTLLIAWVDTVRICIIRRRSTGTVSVDRNEQLPEHQVDPVSTFNTDFYLSGIAPLDQQLVLLGVSKELDSDGRSLRPQLHVVEYRDCDYVEVCTDSLSLRGYPQYSCNDYHLDVLPDENRFFVVAPKDIVVASPYDPDDRIHWLIQHGRYEEAMEAVEQHQPQEQQQQCSVPKRYTALSVGKAYLDHLLATGAYDTAGRLCLKVFGKDTALWQEHIYKFARVQRLRAVSPYLPRQLDCALEPQIYEMVLYEYLRTEPRGFLALVREWHPQLYNTQAVVNAVLEHLLVCDADKSTLMEALAVLYGHEGKYDKALSMYLKLRHHGVFALIQKNNLYSVVHGMIVDLMNLDHERAIEIFLEKNRIPPDVVVEKLESHENLLYRYLDALDRKDSKESGPFHGKMVRLYSIFDRDKLLPFLRRSDQYPIQEALDICQQERYYPEMVFLLGRIGDTKEALELITGQLADMQQALAFCQLHDDAELWSDLIEHSVDRPDFIRFLLPRIGSHVDPRVLVHKITPGLKIEGLKDSLIRMLRQCHLQASIQEGCQKILVSDYFALHERLVRSRQRGLHVAEDLVCGACHRKLVDATRTSDIVVYNCRHTFHERCVPRRPPPDPDIGNCGICRDNNK